MAKGGGFARSLALDALDYRVQHTIDAQSLLMPIVFKLEFNDPAFKPLGYEFAENLPRTANFTLEDLLQGSTLCRLCRFVQIDAHDPAIRMHALRRLIGNHGILLAEDQAAKTPLVDVDAPITET